MLRIEPWGIGEPDEPSFFAKKPDKIINSLLNNRLPKARKALNDLGRVEYEQLAKSICSDVRITIERIIENNLLADVVQRFRRAVTTQGKLENLAKIKIEDCKFIDGMMTQYSKYEHSQPDETPVAPPEPDQIKNDLVKLKQWLDEFEERQPPLI